MGDMLTKRYNRIDLKQFRSVELKNLSLAHVNAVWHKSETDWVDRLQRFGPSYTSPGSSASRCFSQLTAWPWTWFLNLDFTLLHYFYPNRLSGTAPCRTGALIRTQLAPLILVSDERRHVISLRILLQTGTVCSPFLGVFRGK